MTGFFVLAEDVISYHKKLDSYIAFKIFIFAKHQNDG